MNPQKSLSEWEYVLKDFLEMGSSLNPEECLCLVEELRRQSICADSIDVHSTFSIDGKLVVVVEDTNTVECWLYYPKERRILKRALKKPKSR